MPGLTPSPWARGPKPADLPWSSVPSVLEFSRGLWLGMEGGKVGWEPGSFLPLVDPAAPCWEGQPCGVHRVLCLEVPAPLWLSIPPTPGLPCGASAEHLGAPWQLACS